MLDQYCGTGGTNRECQLGQKRSTFKNTEYNNNQLNNGQRRHGLQDVGLSPQKKRRESHLHIVFQRWGLNYSFLQASHTLYG